MAKYNSLVVDKDFITNKKHLFYLMGDVPEEGILYIIASYSVKTDRIILKDVSNFIPSQEALIQFVELVKKRYKEQGEE